MSYDCNDRFIALWVYPLLTETPICQTDLHRSGNLGSHSRPQTVQLDKQAMGPAPTSAHCVHTSHHSVHHLITQHMPSARMRLTVWLLFNCQASLATGDCDSSLRPLTNSNLPSNPAINASRLSARITTIIGLTNRQCWTRSRVLDFGIYCNNICFEVKYNIYIYIYIYIYISIY